MVATTVMSNNKDMSVVRSGANDEIDVYYSYILLLLCEEEE